METVAEGHVLGVGNPLLDFLANVDEQLFAKYNLKTDDAILTDDKDNPLYKELEDKYDVTYAAGGATLNTIKMIQWTLRKPQRCTYIGCIASDYAGDLLKQECDKLGLRTRFEVTGSGSGTGRCAVLLLGKHRSMVTHLGAAKELSLGGLLDASIWSLVESAKVYYISGYVISSCFEGIIEIAKHSRINGKLFCFNLSAPFISTFLTEKLDAILPYVDILFGNKAEALAYGDSHGHFNEPLSKIAQRLCMIKSNSDRPVDRIVIITQDADQVIVARTGEPETKEFAVPHIDDEYIVDTNGAGDAFAAGFIAEYIISGSVEKSIQSALKAAGYIIQRSGFTLGPRDKYDLD
ncbi:unnamed protein product [Dicrocoelium dendriticum]|nr:unnamed protein product [Dicrocoelium dendriticum]